jgi:hypothetical protein
VNTSVTAINFYNNGIGNENASTVDALIARNKRLRRMFLFYARQMLLSLTCADECGVVWPYVLDGDDLNTIKVAPANIETLRAEFAAVVEERRRRAAAAERLVAAEVDDSRDVKRRRTKR